MYPLEPRGSFNGQLCTASCRFVEFGSQHGATEPRGVYGPGIEWHATADIPIETDAVRKSSFLNLVNNTVTIGPLPENLASLQ
jgi:hypothetical protein